MIHCVEDVHHTVKKEVKVEGGADSQEQRCRTNEERGFAYRGRGLLTEAGNRYKPAAATVVVREQKFGGGGDGLSGSVYDC
jgi:hypothetical protein